MNAPVRFRWATSLIAFGVATLVLGAATVAGAQDARVPSIEIRSVDARGATIAVDVMRRGGAKAADLEVEVAGKAVTPTVQSFADAERWSDVVVVLDNSAAVTNGPVQIAKEQLLQLAPGNAGVGRLAVVTVGGGPRVVVPLTTSAATARENLRPVSPGGSPALWDGVVKAAELLGTTPSSAHQIVIVSGARDAGSAATVAAVQDAVRRTGAAVHVLALGGGSPDLESLDRLVRTAGGSMQVGSSNDFAGQFGAVASQIADQYRITFPARSFDGDEVGLRIRWAGAEARAGFEPGRLNVGADALRSTVGERGLLDRLLGSVVTKWLIVLMGTASILMFVYSVAMLITRRRDRLDFALRHYEAYSLDDDGFDGPSDASAAVKKVRFLRKAVDLTGDLAQRQGILAKTEELLERADLPLRPAEALFFYAAGALIAALAALILSGDLLVLAMVLLIALLAPNYVVKFRAARRKKRFVRQLPDMLTLLAGTLRAGYSISQGFDAVSQEIEDPMGRELRRVMAEARLGRPIEEALEASAERTQSEDFAWAVMAIRIQREVGGNLAELLLTVAETMTQRERLRRDVAALTAEGRMSAIVLGLLPPGLAGVMWVMNPEYIGRLTRDGSGITLLVVAGISMLIGFAWMKKIINIEI
jgi:tight adherence protein B